MRILGLSFDFHDAAAALVGDEGVIAAAQEERFSRQKNDPRLPRHAIDFCLQQAGITARQLDHVVFYEMPLLKFERILRCSLRGLPQTLEYFLTTMAAWVHKRKLLVGARIAEALGIPRRRVRYVQHHQAHAASAFFCSSFDEATVVTLDGVGEYETATISIGRGNTLDKIAALELPHSIGLFYSAVTAFLGFEVNEGEYKVMGMAGFGAPRHVDRFRNCLQLRDDGWFAVEQKCFNFTAPIDVPYTAEFTKLFGPPRVPESEFRIEPENDSVDEQKVVATSRHYADLAASAQKVTEEAILHVVANAVKRTGIPRVCMAGGVALNSLANGRIVDELGLPLYVHPAAGDAGGALGAALYYRHCCRGLAPRQPLEHAYLGQAFDSHAIESVVADELGIKVLRPATEDELLHAVARLIQEGKVVGWLQGRAEWGPRALGCRSILANPLDPDMKQIVNEKIKFREPFRPFAPAVLEEAAATYFEMGPVHQATDPKYFMLAICRVRPEMRSLLPAVTHADGTARVQLVARRINPRFYGLIEEFGRQTGVPVLLNTSFNLRGEPIVNSPRDALKTFQWSNMDYLVLEQTLISKDE